MDNSKIDKALKKALENWESSVDSTLWQGISDAVNSKSSKGKKRPFMWILIGSIVVGISIGTYLNVNRNDSSNEIKIQNDKLQSKVESHIDTLKNAKIITLLPIRNEHKSKYSLTSGESTFPVKSNFVNNNDDRLISDDPFLNQIEEGGGTNINNFNFLIHHSVIFANLFKQDLPTRFEIKDPFESNKQLVVRPQKKNNQLRTGPEILISGGLGYVNEKVNRTTTSSITHKDYQKAWNGANNRGIVYNAKIEYYQPIIKGFGISAGLNYIQCQQHISFNYAYSDIPVRDSASKQILGYVHLGNSQQLDIPKTSITNTEIALLTRAYYKFAISSLWDCKLLFGASINAYSHSKGYFYDIDKAAVLQNTRKHSGLLIPEFGVAIRYYLSEHSSLNMGYNIRKSSWDLNQTHGSIHSNGSQQNIQIGLGIIF